MRKLLPFISLAAAGIAFIGAAQAQQMYRWVDKNGKVTYSQDPPPAGAAKKVEQKRLQSSVIDTGGLSYSTQQAAKNFPVTLYTMPDCSACQSGRKLLQDRGLPFKEISVNDPDGLAQLKKLSGQDQLPVLAVGRNMTPGFQADAWNGALDSVGYPKGGEANARRVAAAPAAAPAAPNAAGTPADSSAADGTAPAAAPVPAPSAPAR